MRNAQRRQNEFADRYSTRGTQALRRNRRWPRTQKWKHAIKKTFSPRRVEPPVKVGCGKAVSRNGKLPFAAGLAAVERARPMRPKRSRGGYAHAPAAGLQLGTSLDLVDGLIQKRHSQFRTGGRRGCSSDFNPTGRLERRCADRTRGLRKRQFVGNVFPPQIAGEQTCQIPALRNVPAKRARSGNQVARLRGPADNVPGCRTCRSGSEGCFLMECAVRIARRSPREVRG